MIGIQGEKRRVEPGNMHIPNGNAGYIRVIAMGTAGRKGEKDRDEHNNLSKSAKRPSCSGYTIHSHKDSPKISFLA
jgi:hypothetical protein